MGQEAKIGFHAAYNIESGRETGVGNAVVGAYLNKIGLQYGAVVYITSASPDSMTWLSLSDAEKLGIEVTLVQPEVAAITQTLPSPRPTDGLSALARSWITDVFLGWESTDYMQRFISGLYDDRVFYYGKWKERQAVLTDKMNFVKRWPERSYKIRPESLSVRCDPTLMTCHLEGTVDWQVRSPERAASNLGTAIFSYDIVFRGSFFITSEASTVVNRQSGVPQSPAQKGPSALDCNRMGAAPGVRCHTP